MASKEDAPLFFRIAVAAEVPTIHALIETAFRTSDPRPDWTADEKLNAGFSLPDGFVEKMVSGDKSDFVLVSEIKDGEIAGCVAVLMKQPAGLGRLVFLSVSPAVQRGGMGRKLAKHAEDYAQQTWGAERMELGALATRKQLIEWYGRQGYVETGATEKYDELEFVVMDKTL